jgi:hypothetical protein
LRNDVHRRARQARREHFYQEETPQRAAVIVVKRE